MDVSSDPPTLSRRAALAGTAAALAGSAGCISRAQRVFENTEVEQLSLEIKTVPADSDPFAVEIARHLKTNLEAVGINCRLVVMPLEELHRQVLLNHDFDIYVAQFPYSSPPDPDVLYPLFRSEFSRELGWQNPYGFMDFGCDSLLADQRLERGDKRARTVDELQRLLAHEQPITPVVSSRALTGVQTDRFTGWDAFPDAPTEPHNLLRLEAVDGAERTLRLGVVDGRLTSNRNPISPAFEQEGSLLELVYDSLAITQDGDHLPWMARDITWDTGPPAAVADSEVDAAKDAAEDATRDADADDSDSSLRATITLRDRLRWHDGEPLTAYDVAFTYRFLADTSLGTATNPIPAARFRGRVSLVDGVSVINRDTLVVTFAEATQAVAERALTVPILPAHVWRERAIVTPRENRAGETTTALTWNNPSPVGSGPIRFEDATGGEEVLFSRFRGHFLWREEEGVTASQPIVTESTNATDSTDEVATGSSTNGTVANETAGSVTTIDGTTDGTDSSTNGTANATDSPASTNDTTPVMNATAGGDSTAAVTDETGTIEPEPIDFAPEPEGFEIDPTAVFDALSVQTASSDSSTVELLASGDIDATATNLGPEAVDRIDGDDSLELIDKPSHAFYHLGFNNRRRPLWNPQFRRLVASLVDKSALAADEEVFGAYASPVASVLAGTDWVAADLAWGEGRRADPEVPFISAGGQLAVDVARDRFRALGYQYNADNELVLPIP